MYYFTCVCVCVFECLLYILQNKKKINISPKIYRFAVSPCDHLAYFDRLFFFCVCFSYAYVHVAVAVCECWLKRRWSFRACFVCHRLFPIYAKSVCVLCFYNFSFLYVFLLILKMCKLGAKTCYDYYVWVYLFNLGGYLVWLVLFSNWCFFSLCISNIVKCVSFLHVNVCFDWFCLYFFCLFSHVSFVFWFLLDWMLPSI